MAKQENEISRREALLGAVVLGTGAAVGYQLREGQRSQAFIGGSGPSEPGDSGLLITAADFQAALSEWTDSTADFGAAWTDYGNIWTWGSGAIEVAGIAFSVGQASSLSEAEEQVDTYPTVVITTEGNQYTFTEG